MDILYIIVGIILFYYFFIRPSSKEHFETNQRVIIKTSDNKFAMVCADKHLCATDKDSDKKQFSIMKFADDLIALECDGYYVASCFGDTCKDEMIKVNSFNPYAPNAKLRLVKDDSGYYVQFYDEKYLSLDQNNHFIKDGDKKKAAKIFF